jgi:pyruvate formate lyase activating enzyme
VVFFKGCPLRCVWCQNPEALSRSAEIQRLDARCASCGRCTQACPEGVARPAVEPEPRERCRVCGKCVQICPAGARRVAGQAYTVEALAELLLRDEPFYRHSGGGVTFSGGEPALFAPFAGAVASALRQRSVHVLLETAGHFDWAPFAEWLLPHLSAVYFDVKLADPELHRRFVGVTPERILLNLRRLKEAHACELLPRIPLIPGITDSDANLKSLGGLLRDLGFDRVAILPYNPLWISKRRALSLDLPYAHTGFMERSEIERCRRALAASGLEVVG